MIVKKVIGQVSSLLVEDSRNLLSLLEAMNFNVVRFVAYNPSSNSEGLYVTLRQKKTGLCVEFNDTDGTLIVFKAKEDLSDQQVFVARSPYFYYNLDELKKYLKYVIG